MFDYSMNKQKPTLKKMRLLEWCNKKKDSEFSILGMFICLIYCQWMCHCARTFHIPCRTENLGTLCENVSCYMLLKMTQTLPMSQRAKLLEKKAHHTLFVFSVCFFFWVQQKKKKVLRVFLTGTDSYPHSKEDICCKITKRPACSGGVPYFY